MASRYDIGVVLGDSDIGEPLTVGMATCVPTGTHHCGAAASAMAATRHGSWPDAAVCGGHSCSGARPPLLGLMARLPCYGFPTAQPSKKEVARDGGVLHRSATAHLHRVVARIPYTQQRTTRPSRVAAPSGA